LSRYRERWFYILILPWIIGFILFYFGPILSAFLLSFAEWPLPNPPRWVGFSHFIDLINDPIFRKALLNTAYYALGTVPFGVCLGLFGTLAIIRSGITLFRLVVFFPVASGVATTLMGLD
jgi:multiple sugar transport system permease protein